MNGDTTSRSRPLVEITQNHHDVWLTDDQLDEMIAEEGRDELIPLGRLLAYLGKVDKDALFRYDLSPSFCYINRVIISDVYMFHLADVRRYLKWRAMVWNAWDAELLVAPLTVLHHFETTAGTPLPLVAHRYARRRERGKKALFSI